MGLKDMFSKAKLKVNDVVEKGNSSLTKFNNEKNVTLYSSPVVGGFMIKRAFYEQNRLLFPKENFTSDIKVQAIIGLSEDDEYYVITSIHEELVTKEITVSNKKYAYECYEITYDILNDAFTNEVKDLSFTEPTEEQYSLMREIKEKIEAKSLAMKGKKEFCLMLWQYVIECIGYQLKDHYIVHCFAKIANEYIDDFSSYLIRLFA